jgi:hypothetical protein
MPYSLDEIKELAERKNLKIDWKTIEKYWKQWTEDGKGHNIKFSLRGRGNRDDNQYGGFIEFRKYKGNLYLIKKYEIRPVDHDDNLKIKPSEQIEKNLKQYKK